MCFLLTGGGLGTSVGDVPDVSRLFESRCRCHPLSFLFYFLSVRSLLAQSLRMRFGGVAGKDCACDLGYFKLAAL